MSEEELNGKRLSVSEKRVSEIVEDRLKTFSKDVKLWIVLALIGGQTLAALPPGAPTAPEAVFYRLLSLL